MAIEFQCVKCGKALFAQEQYAGRRTTCPACETKVEIPSPTVAPVVQPVAEVKLEAIPDEINESKRCPYCAEKIQSAARKCRFCGEFLDDDLRREEDVKRKAASPDTNQSRGLRSIQLWRAISILATSLTSGWITFTTLGYLWSRLNPSAANPLPLAPWSLIAFNVALMFGLFRLVRAMKSGPASVFLSAAFAIVCCMPLNVGLGMPMISIEQARVMAPQLKDTTQGEWTFVAIVLYGMIGMCFSLPVWFTALKLAAYARIAQRSSKQ